MPENNTVTMDQLRIGLYVILDLNWFQHPFAFSQFKIKSEEQITEIRKLGLKTVRYNPTLSDMTARQQPAARPPAGSPSPPAGIEAESTGPTAASGASPVTSPEIVTVLAAKRALVERIRAQREAAARVEHAFINAAKAIREIERNLYSDPKETAQRATELVIQIADSILCAPDLAIHVMGDRAGGEELYFHSLNVTMLSLMIARDIGVPQEAYRALGIRGSTVNCVTI